MIRAGLVRLLWGAAIAAAVLLALKLFVADVYRISSGSMSPALFGGEGDAFAEWVLLRYERNPELARWDLVAHRRGDGAVVKRIVGLPGETVRILDGDLWIDGERLPADGPRPDPILVFDDTVLAVEDFFTWRRQNSEQVPAAIWTRDEQGWDLDATRVPAGSNEGMMFYHPELRDDYLDAFGRRVVGKRTVNDAILELSFSLETVDEGVLRAQLVEKGDTFEARIAPSPGDDPSVSHRLELIRRNASSGSEPMQLASAPLSLASIEYHELRFANVDNQLTVSLPTEGVTLTHAYERNARHPQANPASLGDQSVGWRVGFGAEGSRVRFRSIRILRDLHYTSGGEFGVAAARRLGLDEIFVLGDNSRISNDSRHFDAVPLGLVVGRPVFVVWPPSRARAVARPGVVPESD